MRMARGVLLPPVALLVLVMMMAAMPSPSAVSSMALAQSTPSADDDLGEAPDMYGDDDDALGEAPDMYGDDDDGGDRQGASSSSSSSPAQSTAGGGASQPPTPTATTTATTTTAMGDQCGASMLGTRFDPVNLIQRVPNATQETDCCRACQSFQLCRGWSFNSDTSECELFSQAVDGPIPDGTSAFDWSSGAVTPTTPTSYHCSDDTNCADCRSSVGTCTRCTEFHYLLAGQCVPDCVAHGYINFGERKRGRECVIPFTCTGPDCECPSSSFGKYCEECRVEYGGASHCVQCRDDRYLVDGKCRLEIVCRGYRFEEFPDTYCNCFTEENQHNCFRCYHRGGFGAAQPDIRCVRCRNALYFNRDTSLCGGPEDCPSGTVPTNSGGYGRECLPPSLCAQYTHEASGRRCRCPDPINCHTCYFGESGSECRLCRNSLYLYQGECVSSCPSTTAHANTRGDYNRKCTPAFTCTDDVSSLDASQCVCPDYNCVSCTYDIGNAPGESTCLQCRSGYALNQTTGACEQT
ncbi:hypothetical protein PTSG_07366 [Salpingoeca rosetta]|uniref:Apple domain-containing protein n=1 Tax=Salpingoeca rosetta (strain ATCC 50818 / BSB-021) TaxID=946362 RepID=F2UJ76_SALR5|nr:uncharacterized protein PTSG_07366 [Salpingoeca rosetta]EGD77024.1 hypothetical protein PTSG_07366 [Salpingoeca rosetta]|eukprot:XP_004990864.1 hypothetical protein PTSG_07366 [Salpingoeca rosetta]